MTDMTRKPFTGYHMAAILIGFFGIVIAVNIYMAKVAVGTFGGTVVDNSYVASQNYNEWLAT
jgi:nitrogen fixation protein FixH